MLEALCKEWGFYLPCTRNLQQNPFGSGDLAACLEERYIRTRRTKDGERFREEAGNMKRPISALQRRSEYDANYTIIRDAVRLLVLSRVLIFNVFCEALQVASLSETQAKRAWVLFQLFPCISQSVLEVFRLIFRYRDGHQEPLCRRGGRTAIGNSPNVSKTRNVPEVGLRFPSRPGRLPVWTIF